MAKKEEQYECRHILVNGKKCAAVALLQSPWCYFHDRIYRQRAESQRRSQILTVKPSNSESPASSEAKDYGCIPVSPSPALPQAPETFTIDLPLIEDFSSVQLAINNVLQALATNRRDTKRAGLLLDGLQIAQTAIAAQERTPVNDANTVDDIAYTPDGTPVALVDPGWTDSCPLSTHSKHFNVSLIREDPCLAPYPRPTHEKKPARSAGNGSSKGKPLPPTPHPLETVTAGAASTDKSEIGPLLLVSTQNTSKQARPRPLAR